MYENIIKLKEDIQAKKESIKSYMESNGMLRALRVLELLEETSFFRDPASARYHNAIYGGLFLHSFNIIESALAMKKSVMNKTSLDISNESIVIASLLHDACKIGKYKITEKRIQNPDYANDKTRGYGWETKKSYQYSTDKNVYGHGFNSLMRSLEMLKNETGGLDFLTPEEKEAIAYHMGADEGAGKDYHEVYKSNGLAYIIHIADLHAGYYKETSGEMFDLVN